MRAFVQLLSASPSIGKYVKTLNISLSSADDDLFLPFITSRLDSVQELCFDIESRGVVIRPSPFAGIGPVRRLIIKGHHVMQNAASIAYLLNEHLTMKDLELREITDWTVAVNDRGMSALRRSLARPRLVSLIVMGKGVTHALASCLGEGDKQSGLVELIADLLMATDCNAIARIVGSAANSLDFLSINMRSMRSDDVSENDVDELAQVLNEVTSLGSLRLVMDADNAPFLADLLCQVSLPELRKLHISITCYEPTVLSVLEKLSQNLINSRSFPALRVCELILEGYPVDARQEEFQEAVERLYSSIQSRQVVDVQFQ